MGSKESIILCEPQCWGFEHAAFDAALIQTAAMACTQERLVFMGEREHVGRVREILSRESCPDSERVEWREISIPPRNMGGWRRLPSERGWCRRVLKVASARPVKALIFCSLPKTAIAMLKVELFTTHLKVPILVVLHGLLSQIGQPQSVGPWRWATHLRQVLTLLHPRQLTYLVLGGSIRECVAAVLPKAARHFQALDHPYFMSGASTPLDVGTSVRFGYFGVGRAAEKGFDRFARLAEEVQGSHQGAEFVMVGFLYANAGVGIDKCAAIRGLSSAPLSAQEYDARARSVTYAVSLADPVHYRLVASASFLDGLRYLKPGIYVRNPFLEHYFDLMGDIGYLCDSYNEVRDVVFSILQSFPEDRYRRQCDNIVRGRGLFEPQNLAARLRVIIAEAEEAL